MQSTSCSIAVEHLLSSESSTTSCRMTRRELCMQSAAACHSINATYSISSASNGSCASSMLNQGSAVQQQQQSAPCLDTTSELQH